MLNNAKLTKVVLYSYRHLLSEANHFAERRLVQIIHTNN